MTTKLSLFAFFGHKAFFDTWASHTSGISMKTLFVFSSNVWKNPSLLVRKHAMYIMRFFVNSNPSNRKTTLFEPTSYANFACLHY